MYSWLAVPYAEAPTNKNRFMRTVPKEPWKGQLNATVKSNSCIQDSTLYSRTSDFEGFNMWKSKEPFSEDCLFLNIWTPVDAFIKSPLKENTSVPILVFFHGGNTNQGSASDLDLYNPSTFVAASQVIVITVNYRLGVFGFLKLAEVFPGNQGLLDQNEALKWIKENALNMGGDPERITLAGHGSGATLASYHLFIKESHDLFRNIILQSGNPLMSSLKPIKANDANERALRLVNMIGCGSDVKECLQGSDQVAEVSSDLFQDMTNGSFIAQIHFKTAFPPCVDGTLLPKTPEEFLDTGDFKQCSILTGFTAHEGKLLIWQLFFLNRNLMKLENIILSFFTYRREYILKAERLFYNSNVKTVLIKLFKRYLHSLNLRIFYNFRITKCFKIK